MCGIAGCFLDQSNSVSEIEIRRAIDSMSHRGPDNQGFILSDLDSLFGIDEYKENCRVGLVHTRLSINDLSVLGKNPMTYANSKVYIVFNGEIYNFRKLREDLIKKDYKFTTETDTEVIIGLYLEFSDKFVELLDGMFSIAIWDFHQKKLKLFRDRMGIKPLYFLNCHQGFYFASTITTILKLSNLKPEIDQIGLAQQLQFQNQILDRTMFKDILVMQPGTSIIVDSEKLITIKTWWTPKIDANFELNNKMAADHAREILQRSVDSQIVADVKVGTFLSGGIDSACITALAAKNNQDLETFSIGFDEQDVSPDETNFNELELASFSAKHIGVKNYSKKIGPMDYLRNWVDTIIFLEDLRVGPSVQVNFAAKLAKTRCTSVLSGAGGDELFAGYPWRYPSGEGSRDKEFDFWFENFSRLLSQSEVEKIMLDNEIFKKNIWNPKEYLKQIWENLNAANSIDKALLMDIKIFLHGLLLVEDKLSMIESLEVRLPFLSNEMIDFAFSVPNSLKIKNGVGKITLREAARQILPIEISEAKKQGFTPPISSWFKNDLYQYIKEFTIESPVYLPNILKTEYLQKYLSQHIQGDKNHRMLLWTLTSLEIWGRYFILGQPKQHISYDLLRISSKSDSL